MVTHLKNIVDLPTLLGYSLSKMDWLDVKPVYGWGNESEIIKWLDSRDDANKYGGQVYKLNSGFKVPIKNIGQKYPLIWLVEPTQGRAEKFMHYFDSVRLIVANTTKPEKLNAERWKSSIPTLQYISDRILEHLKSGVVRLQDRSSGYRYENRPFESLGEKGQDWWDAVVLTLDLKAESECRELDYLENYCIKIEKEKLC